MVTTFLKRTLALISHIALAIMSQSGIMDRQALMSFNKPCKRKETL